MWCTLSNARAALCTVLVDNELHCCYTKQTAPLGATKSLQKRMTNALYLINFMISNFCEKGTNFELKYKITANVTDRLRVVSFFRPEDRRERASRKPKWRWESARKLGRGRFFVLAPVFARSPTAILAFSTLILDDLPDEERRLLAVYVTDQGRS